MIFEFTYRSGPDWMTPKKVQQDYAEEKIAEAFADGLRRGGAGNVSFLKIDLISPLGQRYYCVVCNQNPVDVNGGYDTCSNCIKSV